MPPSSGHLLVGKAMRLIRFGVEKASRALRDKFPQAGQATIQTTAEPAYARLSAKETGNRLAAIRQTQSRSFSTKHSYGGTRQFSTGRSKAAGALRWVYTSSQTGRRVAQLTSRAPFASTLRPNLTGGAIGRSAGGYNLGAGRVNGARYFSHSPANPAEVVQNVSQAVRAFYISGSKAHFDGYSPRTGEKRYRAVSTVQDKARHALDRSAASSVGSFVDFKVSPTITAIGPLSNVPRTSTTSCDFDVDEDTTIANSQLLTTLEVDFARALKDLAAIMNDLKRLSTLGALPLVLVNQNTLRVRFPGCDKDTVENLCRELHVRRGIVGQDDKFDEHTGAEIALLFPFAPSQTPSENLKVVFENENNRPAKRPKKDRIRWGDMMSEGFSHKSEASHDLLNGVELVENPWLSSPSGYSSLHLSDGHETDVGAMFFQPPSPSRQFAFRPAERPDQGTGYEGVEGIYRFIEECDRVRR